jgi:hypothetical protein
MKSITAIDPGPVQSGVVVWDGVKPKGDIVENNILIEDLTDDTSLDFLVIEQFKPYGMAVGQTTMDAIFWSGRFYQAWKGPAHLLPRIEVKKHICKNGLAKDTNIIHALVDRFAYGERNKGKGTKASPGFFYGFKRDIWQAFALAVTWWDQNMP